jgi:hypothetical protein
VGNVELIIEPISIPTKSFGKQICGRSLADEAGHSEEACNAGADFLEELRFFALVFFVEVIGGASSYLPLALSGDDTQNLVMSVSSKLG